MFKDRCGVLRRHQAVRSGGGTFFWLHPFCAGGGDEAKAAGEPPSWPLVLCSAREAAIRRMALRRPSWREAWPKGNGCFSDHGGYWPCWRFRKIQSPTFMAPQNWSCNQDHLVMHGISPLLGTVVLYRTIQVQDQDAATGDLLSLVADASTLCAQVAWRRYGLIGLAAVSGSRGLRHSFRGAPQA